MKKCCDVLCYSYVDPTSIYRILPRIRSDLNRIQIHWIWPDPMHPYSFCYDNINGLLQLYWLLSVDSVTPSLKISD